MTLTFNPDAQPGKRLKMDGARPLNGRAGELILMDKQGLFRMLLEYENLVKHSDQIRPFVFDYIMRNGRPGTGGKQNEPS